MKINEPNFTFDEVIEIVEISDPHWLRTLIQRAREADGEGIGTKHRLGRLLFSLEDITRIAITYLLNTYVKLPPKAAKEICDTVWYVLAKDPKNHPPLCVGYSKSGEMLLWYIDGDGVVRTMNDAADADAMGTFLASRRPHVVIPALLVLETMNRALQTAKTWKDGEE